MLLECEIFGREQGDLAIGSFAVVQDRADDARFELAVDQVQKVAGLCRVFQRVSSKASDMCTPACVPPLCGA
jgi:hypothetical protein